MTSYPAIAVLGAGAWGTALASSVAASGRDVLLWGRDEAVLAEIATKRTNARYLGSIRLSEQLATTHDLEEACARSVILSVVPAQALNGLLPMISQALAEEAILVLCAKGIDRDTGEFLHTLAARHVGAARTAALSGPSFAHDVAANLPTAVSLAAHTIETARNLATTLSTPTFRIYASDDIIGVEAGGALKNVMALAVGIARGLKLGASAEAALIARGFAEMQRLALVLGARRETLSGLSGLGDLVLTCSSPQSRNFAYGMTLAEGADLTNRPLAEGVATARMAVELAQKNGVEVPILNAVSLVLEGDLGPQSAVADLLARPLRIED